MFGKDQVCLIVDGSEEERRKMRRVMGQFCPNVRMIIARTVTEAMERLRAWDVGFIFIENDLPDGTGLEMALSLQDDTDYRRLPIVLFGDNPTPFMFAKATAAQNVRDVWTKREFTGSSVRRMLGQDLVMH